MTDAKKPNDNTVVSETGVHWHTNISVVIKGQLKALPPDLSGNNIGTQDSSGKVHWGAGGQVTSNQLCLSVFFQTWGQPFSSTQILDKHNGPDGTVSMTVNGQTNTEFENYQIKDHDDIVIRFE